MKRNQLWMVAGALCAALSLSACGGAGADALSASAEPMSETVAAAPVEEEYALQPASEVMTAAEDAQNYLNVMPISRQRLIDQLVYDGFSEADAAAAVDASGADWNEQAVKQAVSYLDTMEFTRDELLDQLEYDKFTPEEAAYAVDNCGADWN